MANIKRVKEKLLQNGFREAKEIQNHFYKELAENVAFIINIICKDARRTEIVYGCSSTAFTRMKNNENALVCYGVFSDDITIRKSAIVGVDEDTTELENKIRQMYLQFSNVSKDELLAVAKDMRKSFIDKFAIPLKQLGLKKKGNIWTLSDGSYIFEIQKSMYSDKYYFNLGPTRLGIPGYSEPFDWQLIDEKVFDRFIDECLLKEVQAELKNILK